MFDTNCLNACLNICEDKGLVFRIVDLEVGNTKDSSTSVTIQGMSFNEEALDEAQIALKAECATHGVSCTPG